MTMPNDTSTPTAVALLTLVALVGLLVVSAGLAILIAGLAIGQWGG